MEGLRGQNSDSIEEDISEIRICPIKQRSTSGKHC
jgi:hypothetical protein